MTTYSLPSVAEDVDDGERGALSMSHLADHSTERQRRLQQAARDAHVLGQTILHQQPTALQYLRKTALRLVTRLGLCQNHTDLFIYLQALHSTCTHETLHSLGQNSGQPNRHSQLTAHLNKHGNDLKLTQTAAHTEILTSALHTKIT